MASRKQTNANIALDKSDKAEMRVSGSNYAKKVKELESELDIMAKNPNIQKDTKLKNMIKKRKEALKKSAIALDDKKSNVMSMVKRLAQSDVNLTDESVEVDEEAQGSISTGSVGVPTMGDGKGGTEPAIYGNSSIVASHRGTVSRRGEYKAPDHCACKKKKKKKKTQKEFVEFYFENEQ